MLKPVQSIAVILLLFSLVFLFFGFNKLTQYSNPESEYADEEEFVNVYVGGDAYNYIINGTQATAYFILSGITIIGGILLFMYQAQIDANNLMRKRADLLVKDVPSKDDPVQL
ncbi:hypothetical protein IMZ31_17080 [Pontibacillus sp. ALD_SL1]|uniref:hypothetical protein n=1 Tax=Pontibacillus sp. ALD_SL1 TaxID=2777185 RepID=UPI001A957001|nr:hypothetical protein [Pontibacillus sp. ALD_SL1]QSS99755.1 hypothetical protein IMZ31_17080 [Pontibacillus sp. ALD_SL1]